MSYLDDNPNQVKNAAYYRRQLKLQEQRITKLEAKSIQDAKDIITLIGQLRYCVGIVERGRNEKMSDDVTPEVYLLEYVKELEALIKESKEQKPVLWVDMQDVAKLKQLKLPVRCIHEQYDADYHPLFAAPVMKEKI